MSDTVIVENIRSDLLTARKSRDIDTVEILLIVLNAIDNASAVDVSGYDISATEVPRRELSLKDVEDIIKNEINEMQKAVLVYGETNHEQTTRLNTQIRVLKRYITKEK